MRVLAIRGRHLASLAAEFEIDFSREPLASAGLYAICGPTGAGKSTLLDALCLALYDCTPRLARAAARATDLPDVGEHTLSQRDGRNVLRRGAVQGWAEVDFTGNDGVAYRARWSVRRAREKSHGKLQPSELSLQRLDDPEQRPIGHLKTEVLAAIEQRTGLSFEQFTRAVLLAQNDFAAFLKAPDNERAELLETLTGTDEFSRLSMLAFRRGQDELKALEALLQQAQQQRPLSDEDRQQLDADHERLQREQDAAERRGKTLHELLDLQRRHQKARDDMAQAVAQRDEVQRQTLQRQLAAAQARAACEQASAQEQQQRPLLDQARDLDAQIRALTPNHATAVRDVAAAQRDADAHQTRLQALQQTHQRHQAGLVARHGEVPPDLPAAIQAQQQVRRQADERLEQLRTAAEAWRCQLDAATQHDTLAREVAQLEAQIDTQQQHISALLQTLPVQQGAAAQAERAWRLALAAASRTAHDLRAQLQPGEPCPVCGSLEHPSAGQPVVQAMVGALEAESKRQSAELVRQQGQLEAARSLLLQHQQAQQVKPLQLAALAQRRDATRAEWLAHPLAQEPVADAQRPDWFGHERRQATAQRDAASQQEAALREWQQQAAEIAHLAGRLADARRVLTDHTLRRDELAAQIDTLTRARAAVFAGTAQHGQTVAVIEQALQQALRVAKAADDAAAQALAQAQTDAARLDGMVQNHRQQIETLAARVADVQRALLQAGDADAATAGAAELARLLAGADAARSQIQQALAQAALARRQDDQRRTQGAELLARIEAQQQRSRLWGSLNEMIGSADGRRFRNYAQQVTLDVLLAHANHQLRQLAPRYRLSRLPGGLALAVKDSDMGGEIRSVHSLSGGESFLLSLALALGLAALSSQRVRVESLFIDEGFGSLDADTLAVAMDALDRLQSQGRKVGVISHVHEMTERIPVRIHVRRGAGGASRVEVRG